MSEQNSINQILPDEAELTLLFRRCLLLTPASLASCSLISLLYMLVGVLLRDRFDGFVYDLEDLWLVVELFKSSFSKEGEDTLDDGDAW